MRDGRWVSGVGVVPSPSSTPSFRHAPVMAGGAIAPTVEGLVTVLAVEGLVLAVEGLVTCCLSLAAPLMAPVGSAVSGSPLL